MIACFLNIPKDHMQCIWIGRNFWNSAMLLVGATHTEQHTHATIMEIALTIVERMPKWVEIASLLKLKNLVWSCFDWTMQFNVK